MTHVVTSGCIGCRHMDCVDVCPVDCFHVGPNFLVINPEECIDCQVCVPECPEDAIVHEDDLSPEALRYLELNADKSNVWPIAEDRQPVLPDLALFSGRQDKTPDMIED